MLALITGGSGYIAGKLAARLLGAGWRVRATCRSPPPAERHTGFEWKHVPDIGPKTDWSQALEGVEVVFHLAAVAHRIHASQAELADEYERVNALGTERLARSLVERGLRARLVMLSSIGAVCTTSEEPVDVNTVPAPDSSYGLSKLHGEQLLVSACQGSPIEWCVLRAPLVYGPGAPGNLRRLFKLMDCRLPLPLSLATARRSFVYVENLVDALEKCATAAQASSRLFLVADNETVSVAELLSMVGKLRGRRVRLFGIPPTSLRAAASLVDLLRGKLGDRNDRFSKAVDMLFASLVLDTSEMRSRLGWQPPHSLRDGIAATLDFPRRRQ